MDQPHGPAPVGRDAWAQALVAIDTPAIRPTALGPGRQPVRGGCNGPGATSFELVARPLWGLAAQAVGGPAGAKTPWDEVRSAPVVAIDPDPA
ncbi:hypothetical protein [Streptomyces sp.]|uniref:hypothetical protein n=1 Tax=Streptomyces sp. TaxID=1931 RepID=UPI0028117912|nr:hypothetical protein [Streptomyces sp.]